MARLTLAFCMFSCGQVTPNEGISSTPLADAPADNEELARALDKAKQASLEARQKITSATGTAIFEEHVQEPGDKEPQLRTKARITFHFDRGKYRMHFEYQTKLIKTGLTDATEQRVVKLIDWKPADYYVLFDGRDVHEVTYSPRINPGGRSMNCASAVPWEGLKRLANPRVRRRAGDPEA